MTEAVHVACAIRGGASLVHGHDGLDEISVCAPTRVSELKDGLVRTYDLDPEPFFGRLAQPEEIGGGDPEANAAITRDILSGAAGAKRDVVLINAGAALMAGGKADTIQSGIDMASQAIDSGKAAEKLDALIEYTQDNG
jgi:anthranilate phosphoribosyltransferase